MKKKTKDADTPYPSIYQPPRTSLAEPRDPQDYYLHHEWQAHQGFEETSPPTFRPKNPLRVYDIVTDQVMSWTADCHTQEDADWYDKLAAALPTEPTRPSHERLTIFTEAKYQHMSAALLLRNHWRGGKSFIVYDKDKALSYPNNKGVDEEIFSEICPAMELETLEVHDYSHPTSRQGYDDRMRNVTVPEFIQAVESGRVVNALDLPDIASKPHGGRFDEKIMLQEIAWQITQKTQPSQQKWYLAASGSAYSDRHFDSDGLATTVQVLRGMKIWILAYLKDKHGMAHINPLRDLRDGEIDPNFLELVPVVLRPGMTLVMAPCTIHLVVTTQPTVAWGRQFYAASTLCETCYGIFHCFTSGRKVTNVTHAEQAHDWLRVILELVYFTLKPQLPQPIPYTLGEYHHVMPKPTTPAGIMDILHVCAVMFLGSAVFPEAYRHKRPLPPGLRERMMRGRQLAIEVGVGIISSRTYLDGQGNDIEDPCNEIFWPFIARQAHAIYCTLQDKTLAPEVPYTSALRFKAKIKTLCGEYHGFEDAYDEIKGKRCSVYGWPNFKFTVGHFRGMQSPHYVPLPPDHNGASMLEWYEGSSYPRPNKA
ncbi:hypothetical protein NP233_g3627 [Leucocoprinus birnbaumii]|uniref:JmjC domain-containing protein n=1 Tax=Leucocoprinus birnbaumii TaxID=56174 RepID=A0AAD5VZZ5_9AGAR|nr:hypothetical protein NP233_g3627 [Leucocoprinus birnbaumii]